MSKFTVRQGKAYRATISLGLVERVASNQLIASRLVDAGFSDVRVTGSGATRQVEARWSKPDTTADMPAQVASISEIA